MARTSYDHVQVQEPFATLHESALQLAPTVIKESHSMPAADKTILLGLQAINEFEVSQMVFSLIVSDIFSEFTLVSDI